ncbi:hypothetical protein U1E44_14600 [Arenibacter sp. GZD96]|uniref:hypothetical protein n=1 Tax=Aurantibrevibacter litoralis TaxID=3106030 RepID=UPI002B000D6F|nr:hypothetical protein [Arenibacter sp. GZD-96]MEA1787329.1 hypothetical protein [Arenibacter sp. GZD-96]
MKALKIITSLFLTLFTVSCSNDDDSNNGPKGYFPTEIEATGFANPNNDETIVIQYNTDNTISRITLTDREGSIRTKNYSYTNGKITRVDNSGFLGGPAIRTFVYNSSGKLSSIIDETGGDSETFAVSYNTTENTYTLTDGDTFGISLDASNNPNLYSSSFFPNPNLTITLDDVNAGVFKNVVPQIALQFDLALFNSGHLFYFFNQKQINHYEFGVQDFEVVNSRDANDNISVVEYNFTGSPIQLNITYQNRTL